MIVESSEDLLVLCRICEKKVIVKHCLLDRCLSNNESSCELLTNI